MTAPATARDYSLNGRENSGPRFADAEWYKDPPVPEKRMKELMARSDRAALMDFGPLGRADLGLSAALLVCGLGHRLGLGPWHWFTA